MSTHFQVNRHDLSIVDPASTSDVVGYTVVRDKGKPQYYELDGKSLVDLFSSNPTQVSTNPEEELVLGQSDFRAGFGKEFFDSGDPKRYHVSNGMDLRNGQGILGWGLTAASTINFPTLTDSGLEIWTDANNLTNWTYYETNAGSVLARESSTIDSGTYSAKITCAGASSADYAQIYQDMVVWNNGLRNVSITVKVRVYNADVTKATGQLIIDDGAATTTASSVGSTAWETVTCTRTLAAGATRLRIILRNLWVSANSECYFDTIYFPDNGAITSHEEFNTHLYFNKGSYIYKVNSSSGAVTIVKGLPGNITSLKTFQISGVDYLFIFLGTSYPYWYMNTAGTFTESSATVNTFQFSAWVNTTADTMYANDTGNTIRSTTNPLNGGVAWSAATYVGSAADAITHLQEKDGALLIDKEDMPYYLDSSGNVQKDLAPECTSGKSTHSGKNSTIWQGMYYRPTGSQALLEIGTTNEWIQPSKYGTSISDFSGQVEAVCGDEEYLYVITDNSTKVEILCEREEYIDGDLKRVWHPIQELTLTGCETAWISTVYQKRLWISSTTATESLYYLPLPTKYGDITNDTNVNFSTGGTFETPWLHGDFRNATKTATKIQVSLGHAYDADIYFECHLKKLGDTSWTDLGDLKGTTSNRKPSLYISTAQTSPMFKLKFVGVTDATNKTPILLDYSLKTHLYPDVKKVILAKVRVGEGSLDKNGQAYPTDWAKQISCLTDCKNATAPITFKEVFTSQNGTTFYGKLLTLPQSADYSWRTPVIQEVGKKPLWEYTLLILVIPLS